MINTCGRLAREVLEGCGSKGCSRMIRKCGSDRGMWEGERNDGVITLPSFTSPVSASSPHRRR